MSLPPSEKLLLAIIIPAYKGRFLPEALASVAAQTDQRFRLYVCDDGSRENLEAIFTTARLSTNAIFHRFEENVGGRSVVESWRRCVARSTEPWVWLFSDDDVMHPECVAAFYHALKQDGDDINVYRFNTLVINYEGQVTKIHPPNPERERAVESIYHRLTNQRLSLAPEHIFRRAAYETRGGFVDFPFALGSDDATWFNLAGADTHLRGISGPRVAWRLSGINISSFSENYAQKLLGLLAYAAWLRQKIPVEAFRTIDGLPTILETEDLIQGWFLSQVRRCWHWFTPGEARLLSDNALRQLGIPSRKTRFVLARSNLYFIYDFSKRTLFNLIGRLHRSIGAEQG